MPRAVGKSNTGWLMTLVAIAIVVIIVIVLWATGVI